MMVTTSRQLRDFAAKAEASPVWTADLQSELQSLITEPALTFLAQTIPPVDRTKAMDNLYRCIPKGWILASQQLSPYLTPDKGPGAVASLAYWAPASSQAIGMPGLRTEAYGKGICKTLAVAITVAIAVAWAMILEANGR